MTTKPPPSRDWFPLLAMAITLITWASAFAAIRIGVEAYDPRHVALLRFGTASLVLIPYALITKMPLPQARDLPRIIGIGFVGITIYHNALNYGQRTVPAGVASFLIATAPLFVAVLAFLFLNERLSRWGWIGVLVSFGGASIIALNGSNGLALNADALLVLCAAIAQGIFITWQKPLLNRYSGLHIASYAIWAGTFFMLIYVPGFVEAVQTADPSATLAIVYMGIFPSVVAYLCFSYALQYMAAARAASFLYLVPVLATFIAWIWVGEIPTIVSLIGGVFVMIGVVMVNWYGKTRTSTKPIIPRQAPAPHQSRG